MHHMAVYSTAMQATHCLVLQASSTTLTHTFQGYENYTAPLKTHTHTLLLLYIKTLHLCLYILQHSTILLSDYHHSGSQGQPRNIPDDYIMLSFACVLLCTLHLNLPALLCVLPALAHSIKVNNSYKHWTSCSGVAFTVPVYVSGLYELESFIVTKFTSSSHFTNV